MPISLENLAERLNARIDGDGSIMVRGCASIETAGPDEITFVANPKYVRHLENTNAAAVLINEKVPCPARLTRLICENPYFAFRNALVEFVGFRVHEPPVGGEPATGEAVISRLAGIHESARIGKQVMIHPHVTVERDAVIGDRTVLYPGVYVGAESKIGSDCQIYPTVTIYDRCTLGDRVTIHASTVVGCDGYGFATHDGAHHKIPQTGFVAIEDDVEIGSNCVLERAAMGATRIGQGTKIGALVSVGHGTTIGRHCLIVSLAGIAGSTEIGNYVVLGGQVGVSGHLKIGDGVQAMARTAIASEIAPGRIIGGAPAVNASIAKRNAVAGTELHELFKRVRRLERQLKRREVDD